MWHQVRYRLGSEDWHPIKNSDLMLYSASTNKQFITVKTRAGETYYMVIDYDQLIDEENEIY